MAFLDETGATILADEVKTYVGNTAVAKETGKGLSTNDYTTDEKTKLAGIVDGANKTIVDSALDASSENPVQNKIVKGAIDELEQDLEVERARIDSFTKLPEGSTTGDAELQDIRVPAEGFSVPEGANAGTSVRSQVIQLDEKIGELKEDINYLANANLLNNSYNDDTGELNGYDTHLICSARKIECIPNTFVKIICDDFSMDGCGVYYYDKNGTYLTHDSAKAGFNKKFYISKVPNNAYLCNFNIWKGSSEILVENIKNIYVISDNRYSNSTNIKGLSNENLFLHSDDLKNTDYWGDYEFLSNVEFNVEDETGNNDAVRFTITSNGNNECWGTKFDKKQNKYCNYVNGIITISYFAKANEDVWVRLHYGSEYFIDSQINKSDEFEHYSFNFNANMLKNQSNKDIFLEFVGWSGRPVSTITISHPKYELGIFPTAYNSNNEEIYVNKSNNHLGVQREFCKIEVPENVGMFVDNVLAIQNNSHGELSGVECWGNAAISFFDNQGIERSAIGYSRNQLSQPNGYIANTIYIECGNPFGESGSDTDFRVIATNSTNFGDGYFFPFEHISKTGATNIRARGGSNITFEGGILPDELYLLSPNGTKFKINVDNNGNITATPLIN